MIIRSHDNISHGTHGIAWHPGIFGKAVPTDVASPGMISVATAKVTHVPMS